MANTELSTISRNLILKDREYFRESEESRSRLHLLFTQLAQCLCEPAVDPVERRHEIRFRLPGHGRDNDVPSVGGNLERCVHRHIQQFKNRLIEYERGAVDFWLSRYGKSESSAVAESPPTYSCGEILAPAEDLRNRAQEDGEQQ